MQRSVSVLILLLVAGAACPPVPAGCDAAPPLLNAFGFSPLSIDSTLAERSVTCDMTLLDDWSGVEEATCEFESASLGQTRSCSTRQAASGHARDGIFSCPVKFPRFVDTGSWVARIKVVDVAGNARTILPASQGLPSQLVVSSDTDLLAPGVGAFSFTPASVDVSLSDETVTCTMQVVDAKSGTELVGCTFTAPGGVSKHGCDAELTVPATGTYSCSFRLPRYSENGSWTPTVRVRDRVGNAADLAYGGGLAVTATSSDTVGPALGSFGLVPGSVSTGEAPRAVLCTMMVTDALSGVDTARCRITLTDPVDPTLVRSEECTGYRPLPGTRLSGIFRCGLTIPRSSAAGSWTAEVTLTDLAGNESTFFPSSAQVAVDCSISDRETTARFTDPFTLAWDPIAGASRYNVYRGTLGDLPARVYGTCQNGRDPDPTDTNFVDTDVPSLLEIGYNYLVSYTTAAVETGLGYDRAGTPRTVSAVCP
jgi:hypothetical protein